MISCSVANIAATALVTDAATALFGEAGVSAATGVMTVGLPLFMGQELPQALKRHCVLRCIIGDVPTCACLTYSWGWVSLHI